MGRRGQQAEPHRFGQHRPRIDEEPVGGIPVARSRRETRLPVPHLLVEVGEEAAQFVVELLALADGGEDAGCGCGIVE